VGPGGVGKSTLAHAVAERFTEQQGAKACLVRLAPIEDGALVATAVATALGISAVTDTPIDSVLAYLAGQEILLLLDNCEHVIEQVAELVELVLRQAPKVRLLATSREPLLAAGEWVERLKPLAVPPTDEALGLADVLSYPSVQLFVERATTSSDTFALEEGDAGPLATICNRVDGIPLAIELVAARVDLFQIRGLAVALDDRLLLQTRGLRSAQPRQQSLGAALEWSHALLTCAERTILRRLSVFRGPFTAEWAAELAADRELPAEEVRDGVVSLAVKSLLTTDASGPAIHYRLLHSTRAFASGKLAEAGEAEDMTRRHAHHFRNLLDGAQVSWANTTRYEWLATFGHTVDDVRAALKWAFSEAGDPTLGASLAAASLPFAYQLSLIDEFKRRTEVSLAILANLEPRNTVAEIRLTGALSILNLNTVVDRYELEDTFAKVVELASRFDEPRHQIEPLLGHVFFRIEVGDYLGGVDRAEALGDCARRVGDPLAILLADRAMAQALHMSGDLNRAKVLAERVLRHPAGAIPMAYSQATVDRRVSMRIITGRILWLEGLADQAAAVMGEALALAREDGPFSTCQALALGGCPLAFWTGDEEAAARLTRELIVEARRLTLNRWLQMGLCFEAALVRMRNSARFPGGAEALLQEPPRPAGVMQHELIATVDETLATPPLARRAAKGESGWCGPELVRADGEALLRLHGMSAAGDAETAFREAARMAIAQGAFAWRLRADTSLAGLLKSVGRQDEAVAVLTESIACFREGFGTRDIRRACALVNEMSGGAQLIRQPPSIA